MNAIFSQLNQMISTSRSFRIIDARTGDPLPSLPSFPSFALARKEAGHLIRSFPFPLAVGRFSA
jgi:hypothetical protein